MTTSETSSKKVHEGRNVKRIRELLGIKQDALATDLGLSQQTISQIEQRETIEPPILEKIAKTLGVPVTAIKNFNEESAVNIIANTINNHDQASTVCYNPTFNPLDKLVELYDALIKEKDSKIALLEKLLEQKK